VRGPIGRWFAAAACALACALVALPGAFARTSADPGVEPARILLGTTASADRSALAIGLKAYLAHVNARGGVAGRRLELVLRDDGGSPETALEATRELVESDGVFAIVSPTGTEEALAAHAYLHGRRVPQLFVPSGASAFAGGRWSLGLGPSARGEGAVYGRFVARTLGPAKVGVLVQAGDVDGRELLSGLRRGLAGSRASVVAVEEVAEGEVDLRSRVSTLRASGADVLVVPVGTEAARQAFAAVRKLRWKPRLLVSAEGAAAPGAPAGAITLGVVKHPADPDWKTDPGMRLYRSVLRRHARGAKAGDTAHVQGMAVAYETVSLLRRLGANPTRAGLMSRARSITSAGNPFLLPGISVRTSRTDVWPVEQGRLLRRANGRWRAFGGLWWTR
jgi:branched-chain amino acid transport system substrate-binding protein